MRSTESWSRRRFFWWFAGWIQTHIDHSDHLTTNSSSYHLETSHRRFKHCYVISVFLKSVFISISPQLLTWHKLYFEFTSQTQSIAHASSRLFSGRIPELECAAEIEPTVTMSINWREEGRENNNSKERHSKIVHFMWTELLQPKISNNENATCCRWSLVSYVRYATNSTHACPVARPPFFDSRHAHFSLWT